MDTMQIGAQIKRHRAELALSQDGLAAKVYVSRQTISNWELGQGAPALDRAAALARLYGVSIDDLANEEVGLVSSAGERPRRDLHVLHGLVGSAVQIELGADDLCFIPRATVLAVGDGWLRIESVEKTATFGSPKTGERRTVKLIDLADITGIAVIADEG